MIIKTSTFPANKLATTVGATGLRSEVVVPQPRIPIPVEEEVEFEFDQKKYEEYLSSSSRSSSPRRSKKVSAARRTRWASEVESQDGESSPVTVGNGKFPSAPKAQVTPAPEMTAHDAPALSKRARQRRRQSMARKFAKAMQSTDGVRHMADLKSRLTQRLQPQVIDGPSKPSTNEWVRVKQNRSTLQERIRKRRALLAQARALVQQARKLNKAEVAKKPPKTHQVWKPKAGTSTKDQPLQADDVKARSPRGNLAPTPIPSPAATFKSPANSDPVPAKPAGSSQSKRTVLERLGPLQDDQGEAPIKERLGPLKRSRTIYNTGGRIHHTPAVPRTGLQIEVREPVKTSNPQGRTSRRVIFKNSDNAAHPQKEASSSDDDNVIPEKSYRHTRGCSGIHADELYYRAGGTSKSRKRSSLDLNTHCPCSQLIRAVLSKCDCTKATSEKVSVFDRLSTDTPKPRSRHFRKRRSVSQSDELPRVTINMTSKGTSTRAIPGASRRMTRLRSGTIRRSNYDKVQRGLPSDDEVSDAGSAMASDNTIDSEGQPREALMVSADQVAKMLEEAMTKQKESFQFEMQMAMQQMREMHDQQIQALMNHPGESSRHKNAHQVDSEADTDEDHNVENPGAGGNLEKANDNVVVPPQSHPSSDVGDNEKIKDLESKINTLISAQEVKKTGIPCPYPREWESIPYPAKFNLINFTPFDGKGSPTQHLIYFKSHLGVISGNEPLMVRSFVGTLRGAAFDWYRRLKSGSINSWDDMETMFLANFFDDDTEISIGTLLDEKQKNGETIDSFVKRFRNKAMNCRDPITEEFILQTCHNNLSLNVLEAMGTAPSKTWRDLKVRGEQAERFLKRKKAERGQQTANAHKQNFVPHGNGMSQAKAVDANQTFQPQQRAQQQPQKQRSSESRFPKVYSFKDDEVPGIFKYLLENNKIQLPPIVNQEEANKVTDPRYCAYHRAVHHPTKSCYHLKDKIQALIDVGVITPKLSKGKNVEGF